MPYSANVESHWRIKEFASRTGVPEVTLRAWERRYGLLDPERSSGGYRLYGPADERRVVAMQAHLNRGIAAAEAARLALAERALPESVPTEPTILHGGLMNAIAQFDATRTDAMLGGAFALGAERAVLEVVLPTLREVGDRWERGTLTVAHEHFATHLIERHLQQHAVRWTEGGGRLALLACPSGERHTLGLMCFGVVLAEAGWRIAYLGADTPVANVRDAADALAPEAIVLSAVDSAPFADAAPELRALAGAHRLTIGGAGATAAIARRLRAAHAPADPAAAAAALAV
jgi:DNA-binding transcriptional MerR regulator